MAENLIHKNEWERVKLIKFSVLYKFLILFSTFGTLNINIQSEPISEGFNLCIFYFIFDSILTEYFKIKKSYKTFYIYQCYTQWIKINDQINVNLMKFNNEFTCKIIIAAQIIMKFAIYLHLMQ